MDDQPSLISQFMIIYALIPDSWAAHKQRLGRSNVHWIVVFFFQYMVLQESNRFQVTHIVVPLPALKLDFVLGVCPSLVKSWHC